MVNNPYFFSTLGTAPSTQIADSSDNPHSGLIKALSVGMTGNYALKSGNNFAITIHSTGNSVTVASGAVFRDGAFSAVGASGTLTLGNTAANSTYSLIVVTSATPNVLAIHTTSTTGIVPAYDLGDIPVALVLYTGAQSTTEIQFLTTNKTVNSLSIGHDDSGYAETANIVGASGVTTITAASGTDVKVKLAGTAAGDTFEVIDSAAEVQFKVQGDGEVSTQGNITVGGNIIKASDGGSAITLDTSDNVTIGNNLKVGGNIIQASDGGNTITLDTSDNVTIGNNLKVGGNVIQASDGGSTITMDTSDNVTIGGGLTTTTTATVGTDLTVTGGDIILANAQNGTLGVAATAAGTAGKDLTISAGTAATAGSNNTDGGDLILNAGSGDGTGTSIMTFNTKVNGTDAVAERMRIHTDGKVGIGTNAPAAPLHVISTDDGETLRLESTDAGAGLAPDLIFKRTSASPATGDNLGSIRFLGTNVNDDGDSATKAEHEFADIYARANDVTLNTEDGELYFRTFLAGTQRRRLDLTPTESAFNEDAQDINFRVEGVGETHALFVQGSDGNVGIGVAAPDTQLHVAGTIKTETIFQSGALITASSAGPGGTLTLSKGIHVVSAPALPGGGPLALIGLEATAENVGIQHKIIVTAAAGAPAIVTLDWSASSQVLVDTTYGTIGGTSSPYTLAVGKAYDLVCVAVNHWMLILLN